MACMLLRAQLRLGRDPAALTMALLLVACGSTTHNEAASSAGTGASAGTAAGASAGTAAGASAGAADGGSSSAGRSSGGSSGSGGGAGAHEQGGSAGRNQGTGGGAANACPGAVLDPARATTPQCSTVADCQNLMPQIFSPRCQTAPPTYQCGGPVPIHECDADAACGAGNICIMSGCRAARCAIGCPTNGCASYEDCMSGHCTLKACDAVDALPCGAGTECKTSNGSAAKCQAIACNAGYTCPATWDCAPGGPLADAHGCVQRACSSSADCACGYCVSGRCEATPGYCFAYMPPA